MSELQFFLACPPNWSSLNGNRTLAESQGAIHGNDPDGQIAAILRDFQADLDAVLNINHACRKTGIGPTTYYRW